MACDFREKFGISVFEAGEKYSWDEAYELLLGLMMEAGTRTRNAIMGWDDITFEQKLLIAIQNSVVETIQVQKKDAKKKQKLKLQLPEKPKAKKAIMTKQEAEAKFAKFGKARKNGSTTS